MLKKTIWTTFERKSIAFDIFITSVFLTTLFVYFRTLLNDVYQLIGENPDILTPYLPKGVVPKDSISSIDNSTECQGCIVSNDHIDNHVLGVMNATISYHFYQILIDNY